MVEEYPRLLEGEELVRIAPQDSGQVVGEHAADVERADAALVEAGLVLFLDPARLVSGEKRLARLEGDARRGEVLRLLERKDEALAEHALRNRHLVDENAVSSVLERRVEREVDARERNAEVVVEGAADGHYLVVQRLVGKRPADICVYVDGKRRHHREVVAVFLLRARRAPLRRGGRRKRVLRPRGPFLRDLHLEDEAVAYRRDKRRKSEYLHLREAGD